MPGMTIFAQAVAWFGDNEKWADISILSDSVIVVELASARGPASWETDLFVLGLLNHRSLWVPPSLLRRNI